MTSSNVVGSGDFTYEMNPDWAKLPEGWEMPTAAVYGDSQDRVYAFNRDPEHPGLHIRQGRQLHLRLGSWPHQLRSLHPAGQQRQRLAGRPQHP